MITDIVPQSHMLTGKLTGKYTIILQSLNNIFIEFI